MSMLAHDFGLGDEPGAGGRPGLGGGLAEENLQSRLAA